VIALEAWGQSPTLSPFLVQSLSEEATGGAPSRAG